MRYKTNRSALFLIGTMGLLILVFCSAKYKPVLLSEKTLEAELKFLPAGDFYSLDFSADSLRPKKNKVSVSAFHIWPYEISNGLYRQYVLALKNSGDSIRAISALPDSTVWLNRESMNQPYVTYYYTHPAYNDYPVIGVTYDQCILFCQWLSEKYNTYANRKYKKVQFDLPSEIEWMYAAASMEQNYYYPWPGPYLLNSNGDHLANYTGISQASLIEVLKDGKRSFQYIGSDEALSDYFAGADGRDVVAPVKSYWPSKFGLYCMAGNAEEFVKEKGITKGGSWRDTGYYLKITSRQKYNSEKSQSAERGFRFVMRVIENF